MAILMTKKQHQVMLDDMQRMLEVQANMALVMEKFRTELSKVREGLTKTDHDLTDTNQSIEEILKGISGVESEMLALTSENYHLTKERGFENKEDNDSWERLNRKKDAQGTQRTIYPKTIHPIYTPPATHTPPTDLPEQKATPPWYQDRLLETTIPTIDVEDEEDDTKDNKDCGVQIVTFKLKDENMVAYSKELPLHEIGLDH